MTRMVVALEGETINNCIIVPGALRCEDDKIPVNWNGDHGQLIGIASKMERDGNEVTMEVELDPKFNLNMKDLEAFVYVQPFESKGQPFVKDAIREVTSGRIRAVALQMKMGPSFPLPKEK